MKKLSLVCLAAILIWTLTRCGSQPQKSEKPAQPASAAQPASTADNTWAQQVLPALVTVDTYDDTRILETVQGFFVAPDLVVTRLSLIGGANKIFLTPFDSQQRLEVEGFTALDRINDLVLLKVKGEPRRALPLYLETAPASAKTVYVARPSNPKTIPLRTGKILSYTQVNGTPVYQITTQIIKGVFGTPVFVSNGQVIGLAFSEIADYKAQYLVTPSRFIAELLARSAEVKPLTETRSTTSRAMAAENSRIRGIQLETDLGTITFRLLNETPEYRDNFIRLTNEGYYNNLLIHRVIPGFGIQSGAADTRYAKKGDVVGWKGPGYTLPAHFVPGLFHRRGVVGSPRKPDSENVRLRSDGSQFYIVSGRTYTDKELDLIEKENDHRFTAAQREYYKTVGGAPHLDGAYTIFGEVTSGIEVVDQITRVEIDKGYRPVNDLRIKKVTILK